VTIDGKDVAKNNWLKTKQEGKKYTIDIPAGSWIFVIG